MEVILMHQKEFFLRLKLQKGLGYRSIQKVVSGLGYQEEEISFDLIQELGLSSDLRNKIYQAMHNEQFTDYIERILLQSEVITIFDSLYPSQLKESLDPPFILFAKGDVSLLKKSITTIVGSRTPTKYSRQVLHTLIPSMVKQDIVIASGLAKGVDAIAHEETILAGGKTIAVVGNGLNYYYPRQNMNLQNEIIEKGLLLSEYLPDTPPQKFRFPERNRILAGLSENVIVTEAKRQSGSLITANLALEANRNIFAVPGPLSSELSQGPNYLIAAGAMPIVDKEFEQLL